MPEGKSRSGITVIEGQMTLFIPPTGPHLHPTASQWTSLFLFCVDLESRSWRSVPKASCVLENATVSVPPRSPPFPLLIVRSGMKRFVARRRLLNFALKTLQKEPGVEGAAWHRNKTKLDPTPKTIVSTCLIVILDFHNWGNVRMLTVVKTQSGNLCGWYWA